MPHPPRLPRHGRAASPLGGAARIVVLSAVSGGLAGGSSFVFLELLDRVTTARLDNGWLVWLLPALGVVVAAVYHRVGGRATGGTGLVIREARCVSEGVPLRMAPLVLGGTLLSHLGGASVGREGTALQLSASLTDGVAQRLRVDTAQRRALLPAAVAGGFAAVFAVPAAAVVFALTVARARRVMTVVACVIAAVIGNAVVGWLGHDHAALPQVPQVAWSPGLLARLALLGAVCGLLARLFVTGTQAIRRLVAATFDRAWVRPAIGGCATLLLMGLVGRDYLGLSLPLIGRAFDGSAHSWTVPLLKLLFTAVALGTGFVGGEVTPLFVVGATSGAAVASLTGDGQIVVVLFVACGFVTVFASAAGAWVAGVVMAIELFGWQVAVPALLVGAVARAVAGHPGLYVNRREIASRPAAAALPNR
jgi:H+/Cl- antiporter ClcA